MKKVKKHCELAGTTFNGLTQVFMLLCPLCIALMIGCGSEEPSSVASSDELARYAAENPDIKPTEPGPEEGP